MEADLAFPASLQASKKTNNANRITGLKPQLAGDKQLAIYKCGRGFELGTTENNPTRGLEPGTPPKSPTHASSNC